MDFFDVVISPPEGKRKPYFSIYPKYHICRTKDLMIRGNAFYAVWDEEKNLWSLDEYDAIDIIDRELRNTYHEFRETHPNEECKVLYLSEASSRSIDNWHHYINHQMFNTYFPLDSKLTFANDEIGREDFRSKRLNYDFGEGDIEYYDKLMSVLYSPEEREKIEWAIGAVVSGDSAKIQKFIVLTGDAGTGKSTVIKIINMLFNGYCAPIDARAIGSSQAQFALEPLKNNPLVAFQDDADLTRLSDNTRLNSLISHEMMTVNEKHKSAYKMSFDAFIFLGSNGEVNITDSKSGIQRRLIDVRPTGKKLPVEQYNKCMDNVGFELGAIAKHCLDVYEANRRKYDNYKPTKTMRATNMFYNFMEERYFDYKEQVSLAQLWKDYKDYAEESGLTFKLSKFQVKNEAMSYFGSFKAECRGPNNEHLRNMFFELKPEKLGIAPEEVDAGVDAATDTWLIFDGSDESAFDYLCTECPAQYATKDEVPGKKWADVTTKLSDIDTRKLHYVKVPENHIVIDFDIKDENGKKSFEKNLEAASKWPRTYAEVSKSQAGIHLHYIYNGDVSKLANKFDDNIEIKVFTGGSSLRRKLTLFNTLAIATLTSGLPMKGEKPVVNLENMQNEKALRALVRKNLRKEIHPGTKPSIDFIYKILEDAYNNKDVKFDLTDLRPAVLTFAMNSTNHSDYCVDVVSKMHFKSENYEKENFVPEPDNATEDYSESDIIFYDVEVFPNLFLVNWKFQGEKAKVVRMINPSPEEVRELFKYRLVGFNNRRYDNHIMYARSMGYTNEELFNLSQKIVAGGNDNKNCFFSEAYNLSYTDIYDFSSKKQSLKKWEIELGLHHQELGLPWDQPVPKELWYKVAEYCDNDVISTEAVFNHLQADFKARMILAELSGLSINDTTNSHTTKLIVGDDRHPQDKFVYTDLSIEFPGYEYNPKGIDKDRYNPGAKIVSGKSIYLGEDPGEGGRVYAEPGMYFNVALLDIASMHPSSAIILNIFGEYTVNFAQLKEIRILIKHREYDKLRTMFDGKLAKYLTSDEDADALSYALKIAINSVYGLTSANFMNKLKDPRNVDNIVAKRGALFMINLQREVQKRGFIVAHIKTDSIKIPNATPEIIQFVMDYGKQYGYDFEHEATYERMCLVNEAVYIAKVKEGKHAGQWVATGTQFQVPYVFKTLFSHEDIVFEDLCETKSISKGSGLYLDMNENLGEDEHDYQFIGRVGSFCPIKAGCNGGELYRENEGKYYAAAGTKGYRWLEAEDVKKYNKEDDIDVSYYDELCQEAIETISQYGDFDLFVSDVIPDQKKTPDVVDIVNSIVSDGREEIPVEEAFELPPWNEEPKKDFMNKPVDAIVA